MQRWSRPRRRRAIALTPLIDVVFLLLIFFVMAGRFSDEARLVLASPSSAPATQEPAPMMLVQVDASGELRLLGRSVGAAELAAIQPDDAAIVLRLDPELPLSGMVEVIDQLKTAGIERLSYWPEATP